MVRALTVRARRCGREAGQASLELISYTLIVALAALACVQGIYVSQAVSVAQQAARDGARVCAQDPSYSRWSPAVDRQLPRWAVRQSATCTTDVSAGTATVVVEVRVPLVVGKRTVSWLTVPRKAVMPLLPGS